MKRKRTITNSLKSPYSSSSQQYSISTTKDYDAYYLPDECWELIFKFLIQDSNYDEHINSLSLVNKQLLSITNRLRFSLTIRGGSMSRFFVHRFFRRFTNLNSLNLTCYKGNLNTLLSQISRFPFKITSLYISNQRKIPRNGLIAFSKKITTLTSLTCSYIRSFPVHDLFLIADLFPNLHHLDLNRCDHLREDGIFYILEICSNITHLNLSGCDLKIHSIPNFQAVNLEVLNLSYSTVDDETLFAISKIFPRLLQLLLKYCHKVTHIGVHPVVRNCTQLKEINLRCCRRAEGYVSVSYMSLVRPSLRRITLPYKS